MTRPATRADGQPAWMNAKPRLRQSDIDSERKWAQSEVRMMRAHMEQQR